MRRRLLQPEECREEWLRAEPFTAEPRRDGLKRQTLIPPTLENLSPAFLNLRIPGIRSPFRAAEALLTHPPPALRAPGLAIEGNESLPLAAA
jgi:hypothetical protein